MKIGANELISHTIYFDHDERKFIRSFVYNCDTHEMTAVYTDTVPYFWDIHPSSCLRYDHQRLLTNILNGNGKLTIAPFLPLVLTKDNAIHTNGTLFDNYIAKLEKALRTNFKPLLKYKSSKNRYLSIDINDMEVGTKSGVKIDDPVMFKLENPNNKVYEINLAYLHSSLNTLYLSWSKYEY